MKNIKNILIVFFAAMLLFSAWKLFGILQGYEQGESEYNELQQYISVTEPPTIPDAAPQATQPEYSHEPTAPEEADDTVWPVVDFEQLAQINPDIVGWIFIEGTDINYPVVQGSDNDYYLRHLFDGTYNSSGCIFLDAACSADFSDQHSIIYGHHMKNGTMFSGLMDYKQQSFYDEHSMALLLTPTHNYKIKLFSGYVSDPWNDAWETEFLDVDFAEWLNAISERSGFEADSYPAEGDRIFTLSTCTYEFENARYVLHGYIEKSIEISNE